MPCNPFYQILVEAVDLIATKGLPSQYLKIMLKKTTRRVKFDRKFARVNSA